jgi:hypothetical protein
VKFSNLPKRDSNLVLLVFALNVSDFLPSNPTAFGSASPVNDDGGVPTADEDALLRSMQS